MSREKLIAEALQAARSAEHNMELIKKNPEVMLPGTATNGMEYLQMMIDFADTEIKNARQARRTSWRTRLKCLVLSIVAVADKADKGETA
ncbi:hypothetical protein [Paenibacillus kandeliae]|uniref:hypothetical protein n=1 Tax=Paenibacillus kandeliae TaxID=3231269 RepID=UPI00345A2B6F